MAHTTDDLFRQAAEAEGGCPVSAGGRVAHVQLALQTGRALQVDLSEVPVENRAAVIAEIADLVKRASTGLERRATTTTDAPA